MAQVFVVASPVSQSVTSRDGDRSAQVINSICGATGAVQSGWAFADGAIDGIEPRQRYKRDQDLSIQLEPNDTLAVNEHVGCQILWPILHGRPDLMRYDAEAFAVYLDANLRLASSLRTRLGHDDIVWVHDYLHIPIGGALRKAGFCGPLGFLFHTPFPAPAVLSALPHFSELIHYLQEYDLIGFQTQNCVNNFCETVRELFGDDDQRITGQAGGAIVETGQFPIPNDTSVISRLAATTDIEKKSRHLGACSGDRELIVSWGTSDYTQALSKRLLGFERFLEIEPRWRSEVSMIQMVIPFREWLDVNHEELLAAGSVLSQINGRFSTLEWTPIKYVLRSPSPAWSAALQRASRVGLITPLSEGMSLIAKDFIAAQDPDNPGALVLSRFAGGSDELSGAIQANPYDPDSIAQAISQGLNMPLDERKARWSDMYRGLESETMETWCDRYLECLRSLGGVRSRVSAA